MKKLISIFTILLMVSCGTRKVDKSSFETKKETVTETVKETVVEIVKVDSTSTENHYNINNDIFCEEFLVEPIDSTQAVEITAPDGKVTKYKNARISQKNKADKSNIIIDSKIVAGLKESVSIKANEKTKSKEKVNEKAKNKQTTAVHFSWWLLLLLLLIPVCRWLYKRFTILQRGMILK